MKRPVLFVAFYYWPTVAAGVVRPGHFSKYLTRMGYQVRVLTSAPPSPPGAVPPPGEVINVPNINRQLDNQHPLRLFERLLRRTMFPHDESFIWNFAALKAADRVVRPQPDHCVISTFPTANTHIVALRLKRRYPSIRWIADFRDPMAYAPGRLASNAKDPLGWIGGRTDVLLERYIMNHADAVVANTPAVHEGWLKLYPHLAHKLHCIMNGVDAEDAVATPELPVRDYKVITHTGEIYHGRKPTRLLMSLGRLIDNGRLDPAKVRINLVGGLDPGSLPEPLATRLVASKTLHYDGTHVPWAEAHRQLGESDYQLLLDVAEGAVQLPSKIFQYLQIGRPILAYTQPGSPTDFVLSQTGTPSVIIYPETPDEKADAQLMDLLAMPSATHAPGEWFQQTFDARRRTERLATIIEGAA
ncbi:MAG: glycosyltransferase [Acidobacteria bacterium]|nr:glycosyltransferase [Acidobacteriota bacterium]